MAPSERFQYGNAPSMEDKDITIGHLRESLKYAIKQRDEIKERYDEIYGWQRDVLSFWEKADKRGSELVMNMAHASLVSAMTTRVIKSWEKS